jgi:flagellar motor switch protein FliN/FliY
VSKAIDPVGGLIKSALGDSAAGIIDPLHKLYESFDKKPTDVAAAAAIPPAAPASAPAASPSTPAPAAGGQAGPVAQPTKANPVRLRRPSSRAASILTTSLDDSRLGG